MESQLNKYQTIAHARNPLLAPMIPKQCMCPQQKSAEIPQNKGYAVGTKSYIKFPSTDWSTTANGSLCLRL